MLPGHRQCQEILRVAQQVLIGGGYAEEVHHAAEAVLEHHRAAAATAVEEDVRVEEGDFFAQRDRRRQRRIGHRRRLGGEGVLSASMNPMRTWFELLADAGGIGIVEQAPVLDLLRYPHHLCAAELDVEVVGLDPFG